MRRLFHQRDPDQPDQYASESVEDLPDGWRIGADLGFTGDAARIRVSPGYKIGNWQSGTPEARQHLNAAVGYLNLIAKRAYAEAQKAGDMEAVKELDALHAALADQILVLVDQIKRSTIARGVDERALESRTFPEGGD